MKISERPEYKTKSKPMTFSETAIVSDVVRMMTENRYGSVVVVNEDHTISGIVTERDLMTKLLYNNMDPKKTKLSDIMTKDVRTANEDDNVIDWLRIMSNERFRHLPVVNESGQIINMMSQGDFVSYTWPDLLDGLKYKAKESWGFGHQVIILVIVLLLYPLLLQFMA